MYAVIRSGGKQYRVSPGDRIRVERLPGAVGESITFEDVLLVGGDDLQLGQPRLEKVRVVGTIVEQEKGDKVLVFKFKRRKMYRRKRGHRQYFTGVQIEEISLEGRKVKREEKAAPEKKGEGVGKAKAGKKVASAGPGEAKSKKAPKAKKEEKAPKKAAPAAEPKPASAPGKGAAARKSPRKGAPKTPSEKKE